MNIQSQAARSFLCPYSPTFSLWWSWKFSSSISLSRWPYLVFSRSLHCGLDTLISSPSLHQGWNLWLYHEGYWNEVFFYFCWYQSPFLLQREPVLFLWKQPCSYWRMIEYRVQCIWGPYCCDTFISLHSKKWNNQREYAWGYSLDNYKACNLHHLKGTFVPNSQGLPKCRR